MFANITKDLTNCRKGRRVTHVTSASVVTGNSAPDTGSNGPASHLNNVKSVILLSNSNGNSPEQPMSPACAVISRSHWNAGTEKEYKPARACSTSFAIDTVQTLSVTASRRCAWGRMAGRKFQALVSGQALTRAFGQSLVAERVSTAVRTMAQPLLESDDVIAQLGAITAGKLASDENVQVRKGPNFSNRCCRQRCPVLVAVSVP